MDHVKNAADEVQVKKAAEKVKSKEQQDEDDMRFVLNTLEGRRMLWRFLQHAGVNKTVWHASALIHYNSGKQDFGHFILASIVDANPDAYLAMLKESKGGIYAK